MKELSFIETDKSFKYSVNLKFDIGNVSKVNNFIPTAKNIKLFEEVLKSFKDNSVSRAHVLKGAYGTGKSLFATVLGTILSDKERNKDKYKALLNKINKFSENLSNIIIDEITNEKPFLVVLPTSNHNNFKQAMLLSLQQKLKDEEIGDIFPSTHFKSVLEKLGQWKQDYNNTYQKFQILLEEKKGLHIDEFKNNIKKFDKKSYEFFINHYSDLTSGGDFNPFYGCDLTEVYMSVNRELKKRGYKGIYVIFDEFNKLLEENIKGFSGKELQDFAEMATRSNQEHIHLLLITHKSITQYTNNLSKKRKDEWSKIEGRFTELDSSQFSSKIFELIESIIYKNKDEWVEYKESHKNEFKKLINGFKNLDLLPSYNLEEKKEHIIFGCYPMHPLTTYLLPKLSQKIAQNERTIFTFLSTDEQNTLGEFLQKESYSNTLPLLNLSYIYDYFEELMRQELDYSQVHKAWVDSQKALQKIKNTELRKKEFIKSLGVINAVNKFSEIPPSKKVLRYIFYYLDENDYNEMVEELIKDKILMYRKSLDHFIFFEGSEIDFDKRINEKIEERSNNFHSKYLLNEYFQPVPIYPKKYNDEYKMKRFFINEFFFVNELKEVKDWEKYLVNYKNNSYLDGLIVYILCENYKEIKKAKKIIQNINSKRVIFVVPDIPLELTDKLKKLDALLLLKDDKDLLEKDALAEKELNAYIEETKQMINNELDTFIKPKTKNSSYFHNKEIKGNIRSRRDLSELTSNICNDEFNETPIINNELIVKNKITSPQKRGRKNVNHKLLFEKLNKRLNIDGYGPDFLIYRTFFIRTNLLLEKETELKFNPNLFYENNNEPQIEENFKKIIITLEKKLFDGNEVNLNDIYDYLRQPPRGIRLGVIPILLVFVGRAFSHFKNSIIMHNGEEKEINENLFEEINRYPHRFTIVKEDINEFEEKYLRFLENLFKKEAKGKKDNDINRQKNILESIKHWYYSLDKFSRETKKYTSEESQIIRKYINSRSNQSQKIILQAIPQKVLNKDKISSEKDFNNLKEIFKMFKIEHAEAITNLNTDLQGELINIFAKDDNEDFLSVLNNWYSSLTKEVRNKTYDSSINSFLNVLRKIKISKLKADEVLDKIAFKLTGFYLEDWNDETYNEFYDRLLKVKEKIEGSSKKDINNKNNKFKFKLIDSEGNQYERNFEKIELNGLASTLEKKIRGSLKNVGDFVSDKEKQQIFINLLKELFN